MREEEERRKEEEDRLQREEEKRRRKELKRKVSVQPHMAVEGKMLAVYDGNVSENGNVGGEIGQEMGSTRIGKFGMDVIYQYHQYHYHHQYL